MSNNKLYTILLTFSDHEIGISQCETETPLEALQEFIQHSESLEGYDRKKLLNSIIPLIQGADIKGIWSFTFDPNLMEDEWPDNNAVLGGHIIQTDEKAPTRSGN